jgi:putative ABC transport system permease protein
MFRGYLTLAWRHFVKSKVARILNIIGLSIGIASCIMAGMFIADELSFDRYNHSARQIFRFATEQISDNGTTSSSAITPPAVANILSRNVSGVGAVTRIFPGWGNRFFVRRSAHDASTDQNAFIEKDVYHVDKTFFDVFTVSFISGTPSSALKEDNAIVLTASIAAKYFGHLNPVGQTLLVDDWKPCKVTAIVQDVPVNSHFHYDFLVPISRFADDVNTASWQWNSFYTYFILKNPVRINAIEQHINTIAMQETNGGRRRYFTQPLTEIHLNSHLLEELSPNGDKNYLYGFALIAFFLFIIACINSTQLITAYSISRIREIGIRKTAGATNWGLVKQFVAESLLTILISAGVSFLFVQLALPVFNHVSGKSLTLTAANNVFVILTLVITCVSAGVFCGLIPFMRFRHVPLTSMLKGNTVSFGVSGQSSILLITQFVIATSLIACRLIISRQVSYMQNVKLGVDKNHVLLAKDVPLTLDSSQSVALRDDFLKIPGVMNVSATDGDLVDHHWTKMVTIPRTNHQQLIHFLSIEPAFADVMKINLAEGSFFVDGKNHGETEILLNETAVRQLGLTSPVVGERIAWKVNANTQVVTYATVTGVVKDFHFASMRENIAPFAFVNNTNRKWNYAIRLSDGAGERTIKLLKDAWDKYIPSRPFQFSFLDASYDKLFQSELIYQQLFSIITLLCIITACLGLFGICAFVIRQRLKETSIRKLLGASVKDLYFVLTAAYMRMIILASLLSFPITWFVMHGWLYQFAYRASIAWWTFFAGDAMVLFAALITISVQVTRAARVNPVTNLRD